MPFKTNGWILAAIALGALVCVEPRSAADATPKRWLLALSKADHTLAIVDPTTLKVVARLPVGPDPHEVVASADGKTAFVSNTGSGRFHEIDVLDLDARKALPSVDTGALLGPHGLDFVGGKLWFTAEGAKAIARYDRTSGKLDWIMGTGQNRTHMIHVGADEKRIYATNVDSGTVSVFDNVLLAPPTPPTGKPAPGAQPHLEWVQTVIPVAKGNEGFDVSPDGRELWTAAPESGTISVVDLATKKVTATIEAKVFGANRLKLTPDGKRVLVSSLRTGDLTVYDTASHRELQRLSLGHGAAGLLIDSDGSRAFVACSADNYVAVVDLKTYAITARIDAGGRPDGLAWAVPRF